MSKIFEQLVEKRGLTREFLEPRYEECAAPGELPDMAAAVQRLGQAKARGEKVLIYGDYDVDGVTASTALDEALRLTGIEVAEVMLPNRFTDGYGMSRKVVERARETGAKLVVTVDCGSRNQEIVQELLEAGVETVVTDHHECGETLPAAVAVVNPKRRDVGASGVELRELAGVGVVFKLAQALVEAGMIPAGQEKWLLDLVLIGTICDSMRLLGENRRLVYYGMKVLEKTRRVGLQELLRTAGEKLMGGIRMGIKVFLILFTAAIVLYFKKNGLSVESASAFIDWPVLQMIPVLGWQIAVYRLILLGGEFRPISRTLVGPLTAPVGEALHIDKAFFGTIGITADGLSTTDPGEAYTKKLMLRRAHKAILLADSGKFGCASLVASGSLRDLDIVITDRGLSPEFARLLRRNKIEVVTQ